MPPRHLKPPPWITLARKALHLLPDRVGFPLVRGLSAQVDRSPLTAQQRLAIDRARRLSLVNRPLYRWGEGPVVLLVHGWAGRAGQMAPLALSLAQRGFEAVAFDVHGHGEAPGSTTSWSTFLEDIEHVSRALEEPIFAFVGHSAGALSLMTARSRGLCAEKFLGICAPSHPFPALDFIDRILAPSHGVMEAYRHDVARQLGFTWSELQAAQAYRPAGPETLLVYDLGDKIVPSEEGEKIRAVSPQVRLTTLGPFGHTRILGETILHDTVGDFLLEENPTIDPTVPSGPPGTGLETT